MMRDLTEAIRPLVAIGAAYHDTNLFKGAHKSWGHNGEHCNSCDPASIELYRGRGGSTHLTLGQALHAYRLAGGKEV